MPSEGHRGEQPGQRHPRGPEDHQSLKQQLRFRSIDDLIVLDVNNDPFYFGRLMDWRNAEWFMHNIWDRFAPNAGSCISGVCTIGRSPPATCYRRRASPGMASRARSCTPRSETST